jgi:hypothetical protein
MRYHSPCQVGVLTQSRIVGRLLADRPAYKPKKAVGHTQSPQNDTEAQGSGVPSTGIWPRPHWYLLKAHQKEGISHVLVVRLGKDTNKRASLWWLQGLEKGGAGVEEVGGEGQGTA